MSWHFVKESGKLTQAGQGALGEYPSGFLTWLTLYEVLRVGFLSRVIIQEILFTTDVFSDG